MPTREEMRSLAEEIVDSYSDRVAGIAQLRETVKMDLRELRTHRVAMSREMRADLARDAANRKHEVGTMLKEFDDAHAAMSKELKANLARGVADCKRSVGAMLNSFGQSRTAMSKRIRADLAKGVTDRKHEVSATLKGFSVELNEVRSELAGARDEWQTLTATMQAQRVGLAVEVKPPEAVVVPAEKIAEEEAVEITPETVALSDRVFEYLANHPDGARMTELEQEFGVPRIQMARLLRGLMDENKVKKQELLYLAI